VFQKKSPDSPIFKMLGQFAGLAAGKSFSVASRLAGQRRFVV
jgi:hypothetical protein